MALRIRYLAMAGFELVTSHGTKVVIDPILRAGGRHGVPSSPVPIEELDDTKLVLVSHGAWDHRESAVEIAKRSGASLVCDSGVRQEALRLGLPDERVLNVVSGCEVRCDDVLVRAVEARHQSFFESGGHWYSAQPLGYVIKTRDDGVVYHPGDTSLFSDLKLIGELHKPDLAFLGVGGVEYYGRPIVEMHPDEAAIAAGWLGVKVAIPMHYLPGRGDEERFARECAARHPEITVKIMQLGEVYIFDRRAVVA
jgi:L-ascorbate metabolism protein UlaG (beta-lactamase superfamily)